MNTHVLNTIIKKYRPNWPKVGRLIGSGSFGYVFNTNDGRVMKLAIGNLSHEFNVLKNLKSAHYVPKVRNNNFITFNKNNNSNNIGLKFFRKAPYKKLQAYLMSKVGGANAMTLEQYKYRYMNKYALNANLIKQRKYELLQNLHVHGFNHSNVHNGNIIVTVTPNGKIKGMWLIDFGYASRLPLGTTGNWRNFANIIYERQPNAEALAKKMAQRRSAIAKNLKLLTNSTKRVGRSKSASPPRRRSVKRQSPI
jgi:hypothetical protein